MLSEFGVNDCEPIYQYFDQQDNLQLELYEDKDSETFCGIVYDCYFDSNQEERKIPYGFAGSPAEKQTWIKEDAFSTKSVYGDDGTDYVENPEEIMEYTPDGKPDYYRCQGLIEKKVDGKLL